MLVFLFAVSRWVQRNDRVTDLPPGFLLGLLFAVSRWVQRNQQGAARLDHDAARVSIRCTHRQRNGTFIVSAFMVRRNVSIRCLAMGTAERAASPANAAKAAGVSIRCLAMGTAERRSRWFCAFHSFSHITVVYCITVGLTSGFYSLSRDGYSGTSPSHFGPSALRGFYSLSRDGYSGTRSGRSRRSPLAVSIRCLAMGTAERAHRPQGEMGRRVSIRCLAMGTAEQRSTSSGRRSAEFLFAVSRWVQRNSGITAGTHDPSFYSLSRDGYSGTTFSPYRTPRLTFLFAVSRWVQRNHSSSSPGRART